jgi:GNAT superfamily N-acetyltransferase
VEENCFRCKISEMMIYVAMLMEKGPALDWVEILKLEDRHAPICYIGVLDDQYRQMVLGSAVLSYETEGNVLTELRFDKIQVDESWRKKRIGTTIMAMIFAIARYYQVRRITGTIYGDKFLWHWYAKLGFTIYDRNKLLKEFEHEPCHRSRHPSAPWRLPLPLSRVLKV